MNWININKQTPPFETPVLVFGESKICIARLDRMRVSKSITSFDFLEGVSGLDDLYIDPTHWMPLPEPPNED